jgi:import inner membrane translocase subunit TIM50
MSLKLDPSQTIFTYGLYEDSMSLYQNKRVKDISILNRQVNKVVMLESDTTAANLFPKNVVYIKPWNGDPNDTSLVDLVPFFKG